MRGLILFLIALSIFLLNSTELVYPQNPNVIISVNNNPNEEYLFLGLAFGNFGRLWIVDNDLTPVFYKKVTGTIYDFKYQPNGELTYNIYSVLSFGLDNSGNLSNQFFTPPGYALDVHELQVLEDGSYYILGRNHITVDMSQYVAGGDTAALLVASTIHHMDSNDNELWRWESFDHYDILDVDEYIDLTQPTIDWTHCNSIEIDNDGHILLSTRNFNEITKINRQTGEIIWRLGGEQNQFLFINDNRGFTRQHDARRISNGNLALFDNGKYAIPEYSSYVEYELDEVNLTATFIRRYSRNETVYTSSRGGAQELINGHTLISWGEDHDPAITEVNDQDSIEFEIKFPVSTHQYRAYRFKWQTDYFVSSVDSIDFGITNIGSQVVKDIYISNTKNDSSIINEFYLKDSIFYVSNSLPIIIPPQDSVKLSVIFNPNDDGIFKDKLNVRHVTDTLILAKQIYLKGATALSSADEELYSIPNSYSISQNYPNPFNPVTSINFSLPQTENVEIFLFNQLGEKVKEVVNEQFNTGEHIVSFSANDLPSGIYFYRFKTENFMQTKKLVLLK